MNGLFKTFLILTLAVNLKAQGQSAYQIMKTDLNKGNWKDMVGSVEMILINSRGEKRVRKIQMMNRKRTANESDMLMRFKYPDDVRGTGFLLKEHENTDDERYLYLPALHRIKRIASSGKGGNFMSSDFSYYDIGKPKLNDWKYSLLGSEEIAGHPCYKILCMPASPEIVDETGYGKIIRWIRKDIYVTLKSVYFDRGGQKWKVLNVTDYKKISGVWFQTGMVMKDVQNNHETKMIFKDLKVNTNIPELFFTKRFLQRGR